ncbi:MAG: hypothetical protein OEW48_00070 [Phycisphaerae bacterium]|nr:hypothetical protein [Phycisphaerae bacterium]
MGNIWSTNESVFFVGGRGTKAGDANAGGGCTKDVWGDLKSPNLSLSDVMGTNGEPVSDPSAWNGSATACTVTQSSAGKLLITKTGAFTNVIAELIANVNFSSVYGDGRFRVNAAQLTPNTIEIEYPYSVDNTCDVKVGGAFDKLQTALDNTTADQTSYNDVNILTNKSMTFSGTGDRIDIDAGGGNGNAGTWKRIIGIDDNGVELAAGSYVQFDANGYACHVFKVLNVHCIEFRHICVSDAANTHYGFYITATGYYQGFLLKDCKSTGCKYGVYSDTFYIRGLIIMGGYYSSATGPALCFQACRWVNVLGVELVGSLAGALIDGDVIGTLLVDGCVLRKTGNYSLGIHSNNWDTFLVIRNCVFYDIDDCIKLNDAESRLVQHNNIFLLHTAATGEVINRVAGSIMYSDYSCAWAIDGEPMASGRWGGNGLPEHAIEQDPQFVDADNGDFRPRNQNVLRGGKPDIADNETEMGAILQKYQFARRAKAANFGRLQIMR